MKKKIFLVSLMALMLIAGLFILTGCENEDEGSTKSKAKKSTKNETTETTETAEISEKVEFTKEVKYKTPEKIDSIGSFKDLGHTCTISHYTNQTSVYALYPFDDKVENIDKVTINGFDYDTYKYVDNTMIHYVYRTKVNNDYHLFQYDVYAKEYDDSQVEAFMNTVEYIYDSID